MISHKHKCIFVHIPKVAGQSIETFFLHDENLTWETREKLLLKANNNPKKGPPRLAHLTATQYREFNYINQEDFNAYFKFSFVRNPWSRVVSFYKYLGYSLIMTFEYFVKNELENLERNNKYFFGSQYSYLYNNQNQLLVDYVGKLESIKTDFEDVCNKLNIENQKLPHVNKSVKKTKLKKLRAMLSIYKNKPSLVFNYSTDKINSKNYKDYYTEELKSIVNKVYKDDVEAFNYSF